MKYNRNINVVCCKCYSYKKAVAVEFYSRLFYLGAMTLIRGSTVQEISSADVATVLGGVDGLILRELIRTRATRSELRRAAQIARLLKPETRTGDEALSPRMLRLVDLCVVAISDRSGRAREQRVNVDVA